MKVVKLPFAVDPLLRFHRIVTPFEGIAPRDFRSSRDTARWRWHFSSKHLSRKTGHTPTCGGPGMRLYWKAHSNSG